MSLLIPTWDNRLVPLSSFIVFVHMFNVPPHTYMDNRLVPLSSFIVFVHMFNVSPHTYMDNRLVPLSSFIVFVHMFKDLMQRKKRKKYFSFYIDNILIKTSSI